MKRFGLVAATLLLASPAQASLDETLDISLHGTYAALDQHHPMGGVGARVGVSSRAFRFGAGAGIADGVRTGEAFVALTAGGFWKMRPFFEVRGHLDRVDDETRNGLGFRGGVLLPLSEYFFFDIGAGRDVIGPERFRASIGLGLPIPLSHL
ncbi:MAG: hypothetical protein ACXVCJ_29215 [Polyangiales bacterium]